MSTFDMVHPVHHIMNERSSANHWNLHLVCMLVTHDWVHMPRHVGLGTVDGDVTVYTTLVVHVRTFVEVVPGNHI